MFHLHKWSKWKTYTMRYIVLDKRTGAEHNTYERHQERTCSRCGEIRDREV